MSSKSDKVEMVLTATREVDGFGLYEYQKTVVVDTKTMKIETDLPVAPLVPELDSEEEMELAVEELGYDQDEAAYIFGEFKITLKPKKTAPKAKPKKKEKVGNQIH